MKKTCPNREHGPWCNRAYSCHETPSDPRQPPMGGFCDHCGHFAARHDETGCHWPDDDCHCEGMQWRGYRWPRPWLAAPDGLRSA